MQSFKFKDIIKFVFFFLLTIFLFWWVYKDQNWNQVLFSIKNDVDYTWMWVAVVIGIFSHVLRALRWQQLGRSMNYSISFPNSFMGVMIGYFANMILPRMGEFTRCGVVSKYEKVPFSNLLGTVVTERVIDLMILLSLTVVVVVAQFSKIIEFWNNNQAVRDNIDHLTQSYWMYVILGVLIVIVVLLYRAIKYGRLGGKIKKFLLGLKEGFFSIRKVDNKGLFIVYSLGIWLMYFLMMYVCFFCFQFTSHLGVMIGLTVFVLSSYGMVAPVQGGIGAWHFMVISALLLYVPNTPENVSLAKTFALLTHGAMTLLYIVVGALSLMVLPIYNKFYNKAGRQETSPKQHK